MKRSLLFWLLAFIITLTSAIYQRMTGPTYPVSGKVEVGGKEISYKLKRSDESVKNHIVQISVPDSTILGYIEWKRFKTNDAWTRTNMIYNKGILTAELPVQPPAGKLQYKVYLQDSQSNPATPLNNEPVIIRFKGVVPLVVLIFHVIIIFSAMLFSARTGIEAFSPQPNFTGLTYWTVVLLFAGGLILGPIVQKFAFDAFWTGWPFGHDLTYNKTAVALLSWIAAAISLKKSAHPKRWILAAALITLVVFLIPHSVLGSELDYSKMK